ncbi:hypothetical protein AMJ80_02380 [bacterium SM23_31]|nr:MAG: hypothetical protein AMJ80_02380 [bacterium SM23_31]
MKTLKSLTGKLIAKQIEDGKINKTQTISKEAAENQVVELLNYYDIDIETFDMTKDTEFAGERTLKALVNYYRKGQLKNRKDEKSFKVIQTLRSGTTVDYGEPTATTKMQLDKVDNNDTYERIYTFMGSLGNLDIESIKKFHSNDLAVLEVLGNTFLLA